VLEREIDMNKHEIIWRYIKVVGTYTILLAVVSVAVYKCAALDLGIAAGALDASDLLALLLAFFSVGLAVMFYFRSSEDSNRFYENSYSFTKEMSELLGRIEAGFGERLRHLDEGYSDISKKFDNIMLERQKTEEQVEKEEDDVQKIVKEKQEMIESLVERSGLQEAERRKIIEDLTQKDEELQAAQAQLQQYRARLRKLERHSGVDRFVEIPDSLSEAFYQLGKLIGVRHFVAAPPTWLERRLKKEEPEMTEFVKKALREHDVVDSEFRLTRRGRELLRLFGERQDF
jgi:hypothetical protein